MIFKFAWRYFRAKKSVNAINLIAWISMVAIGVVTAALIVVLSVFNGFENLVQQLYGNFYADLLVKPAQGKWLTLSPAQQQQIASLLPGGRLMPIIEERAILLDQDDKSIVWLKGVPNDYATVSGVDDHILRGSFYTGSADSPAVVLGVGVENALQVQAGQAVFPGTG